MELLRSQERLLIAIYNNKLLRKPIKGKTVFYIQDNETIGDADIISRSAIERLFTMGLVDEKYRITPEGKKIVKDYILKNISVPSA